jgi:hypothetical protein
MTLKANRDDPEDTHWIVWNDYGPVEEDLNWVDAKKLVDTTNADLADGGPVYAEHSLTGESYEGDA